MTHNILCKCGCGYPTSAPNGYVPLHTPKPGSKIMRTAHAKDLGGVAEVADMMGISKATLVNWRKRHSDFPEPFIELACGPIWVMTDVSAWYFGRKWDTRGGHYSGK